MNNYIRIFLCFTILFLISACGQINIQGPAEREKNEAKINLKFVKAELLSHETGEVPIVFDSVEKITAWDNTTFNPTFLVEKNGEPVSGIKVTVSSDDHGVTKGFTDENGMVTLSEPVGGNASKYGPITSDFLSNLLYKSEGGGKLRLRFPVRKTKPTDIIESGEMVSGEIIETDIIETETETEETLKWLALKGGDIIYVKGLPKRVDIVKAYTTTKSPKSTFQIISSEESRRDEDGMSKRGVYLSRSPDFAISTFVPISEELADGKKEICVEQTGRVHAFLQLPLPEPEKLVAVKADEVVPEKSLLDIRLCLKEDGSGEPIRPFKIVGTHGYDNWVVLTERGDEEKVSFWVEDTLGRRVYLPSGEFEISDIYLISQENPFPDPVSCIKSYTKIWDKECEENQDGTFTISIKEEPNIEKLVVPWKTLGR